MEIYSESLPKVSIEISQANVFTILNYISGILVIVLLDIPSKMSSGIHQEIILAIFIMIFP